MQGHISLAHLHLLSPKSNKLTFFPPVWKPGLNFVGPHWRAMLLFFYFWFHPLENTILFCQPGPAHWKILFSFVVPACSKNHPLFASLAQIIQEDEHEQGKMFFWRLKEIHLFIGEEKLLEPLVTCNLFSGFQNLAKLKPISVPDK